MNINGQIWFILASFILMIMALIIFTFSFDNLRTDFTTNNLDEASKMALYYSTDKASRAQRGVLYVNPAQYKQVLSKIHIRKFGGNAVNDNNYRISYLPDKSADLVSSKTQSENGASDNSYIPVRGIEVATYYSANSHQNRLPTKQEMASIHSKNQKSQNYNLYSTDYLVDSDGRVRNNDADNDITRPQDNTLDNMGY